jgi:hypothetical protein
MCLFGLVFLCSLSARTLAFNWPSYAAPDRTIVTTSSGFVKLSDSTAPLCNTGGNWLLDGFKQAASISTGGQSSCTDSLSATFSWSGAKTDCGAPYFATSGGNVSFVYRSVSTRQLLSV